MLLFSGTDSFSAKRALIGRLIEEINNYEREYLLNANLEDLVTYLVDKYRLELPGFTLQIRK